MGQGQGAALQATVPALCAERGRVLLRDRTSLCLSRTLLGLSSKRPTPEGPQRRGHLEVPLLRLKPLPFPEGHSQLETPLQDISQGPQNGACERKTPAWPSTVVTRPKADTCSTRAKALLSSRLLCPPRADPVALVCSSWSGGRDGKKEDRKSQSASQWLGRQHHSGQKTQSMDESRLFNYQSDCPSKRKTAKKLRVLLRTLYRVEREPHGEGLGREEERRKSFSVHTLSSPAC